MNRGERSGEDLSQSKQAPSPWLPQRRRQTTQVSRIAYTVKDCCQIEIELGDHYVITLARRLGSLPLRMVRSEGRARVTGKRIHGQKLDADFP